MRSRLLVGTLLILTALAAPARAEQRAQPRAKPRPQQSVPSKDAWAAGGEFGRYIARYPVDRGATFRVLYETYLNPRVSIRPTFGWTNPHFKESGDTLRQNRLSVDLLYNVERGKMHPFAGAGVGAYFLKYLPGGQPDLAMSRNRMGMSVGGGVEYFARPLLAVKGEVRYHYVGQGDLPWKLSGLDFTVGVKQYF